MTERDTTRLRGAGRNQRRKRLMLALLEGQTDLEKLASEVGVSLDTLATLVGDAGTARALEGLRRIADVQTQIMVSRYRLTAAARLIALANQEDDPELARRASSDLLKTDVLKGIVLGDGEAAGEGSSAEVMNESSVLAALKALGS